jgi:hypothetical protein
VAEKAAPGHRPLQKHIEQHVEALGEVPYLEENPLFDDLRIFRPISVTAGDSTPEIWRC